MKQKMKSLVSAAAVVLMLVSMFSVCVFPASAASGDGYSALQAGALVVNTAWSDVSVGETVSYTYRGKTIEEPFEAGWHFASFEDAWDYAVANNRTNPTIMICGTYDQEIKIEGAVTIIGANAGIDPVKESANVNNPWELSSKFVADSSITGSVVVTNNAVDADITFDGVRFGEGGAFMDYYRSTGGSDITFKNVAFEKAGNSDSDNYALYLFSKGHARNLSFENVYVTGQNVQGFISPYFSKLVATRVAYVNNGQGILNKTSFEAGVAPYVEFTDSCFYNESVPSGYVISMDNHSQTFNYSIDGTLSDAGITSSDQRPSSMLVVSGCTFYNASAANGLIHYEFINRNSSFELDGNYIYSSAPTTVLAPEFLLDSANIDQTACMHISGNWLMGAYKIPDVSAGNAATYVDVSYNYFGDAAGECVEDTVYMNPEKPKVIRTAFWIDPEMTSLNTDPIWNVNIDGWNMYSVDNFDYEIDLTVYEETGVTEFKPTFTVGGGGNIQLYKSAVEEDGVITSLSNPIDRITMADLNQNIYVPTVFYAQITNSDYPTFAPVYTITVDSVGSIDDAPYFSEEWPGVYMYQPTVANNAVSTMVPYRWQGKVYRMEVGKTLFADVKSLIAYAKKQGHDIPTIAVPAGTYSEEMVITGSCTILGEQYGVNPNVKPIEVLTQSNVSTAGWTLNPERADASRESVFNACIRVDASANDYVITVDGIKMGEGCSYVDDEARADGTTNVTIFKNVIAESAGGGKDRTGAANLYVFNFNKAFVPGAQTDRAHVYFYDVRIDRNQKCNVLGPYIEKLVMDGVFFGNAMADGATFRGFLMSYASRDVANPYTSLTNSCFFNNAKSNTNSVGLGGCYVIDPADNQGTLSLKKNIIYNFDNNLFYNGFGSANAAMEVQFTGSNMKFFLTNNTIVETRTYQDSFFAGNQNGTRWVGDSASYDCSDAIICKGNRIVRLNQIPLTHGTGNGTLIDYSGNYWADTIDANTGERPNELAFASGRNTNYTEADHKKVSVDFTYLDWEMTKRSNAASEDVALYTLNNGMYGTGTYELDGTYDNKTTDIFRDSVPADCEVYEIPAAISAGCSVKIEKRITRTRYVPADFMAPDATSGEDPVYRITVTSDITGTSSSFIVSLTCKANHKAELLEIGTGSNSVYSYVDEAAKTAYIHTPNETYDFYPSLIKVSSKADFGLYSDADCKIALTDSVPVAYGSDALCYLQVTSEDENTTNVYTVKLTRYSESNPINLPAVKNISNMTYVGDNTYEAAVSDSITIQPSLYQGATAKIYSGSTLLTDTNGKYTFEDVANGATYRMVVTAGDGVTTKTYTLRFVQEKSSECELYSIEGATKTAEGYVWNMKYANAAVMNAEVSDGATYQVYADQTMLQPYADNRVLLPENEGTTVYVKVTAENGKDYATYSVSVLTQANVSVKPAFTVKVGNTEYPAYLTGYNEYAAYLPAGVKEATLSVNSNTDGSVTMYSSADRTLAISTDKAIKLDQKITNLYYTQAEAIRTVEYEGELRDARNPEEYGVLTIISDREAVAYQDASKITSWAKEYVNFLNEEGYGIMVGDANGNFNATGKVTRYQMAVVAAHIMGMDVNHFSDVELEYADSIVDWAKPYVRAVTAAGVMSGTTNGSKVIFNGNANATREQVATIMVNIYLMSEGLIQPTSLLDTAIKTGADYYARYKNELDIVYNSYDFADESKVASWAKPYMRLAVDLGIMSGSLNNGKLYLNPKATVTRAQLAVMVANYVAE